ncbi:TorF family putative porin [Aliihoeflea sp. 2WW]|uniref:TorF family putative porin n=1 Tax=Aliihoeflea sp. 2WW TaxID=1381123 RepID=UPI000464BF6C|nr:TorF family putative porin [Aliihoeflea sp. 2WW]
MNLIRTSAAAIAIAAVSALPAFAADAVVYEAPVVLEEEVASAIDIAFGATFTSRYVSRGVAYTDGPTLQGYVEASYDWAYVGVWASGVSGINADPDNVEIDVYGGIRPTFGNLTVDIGYVHYFYDETGECCGEAYIKPSYQFTDEFSAGLELYHDFESDATYGVATAAVELPYDFTLSGGIGRQFQDGNEVDWNVGLSYTYADLVTFDVRYHDSDFNREYFVASVSFDTSFNSVREMFAGGQFGGGR